MRRKRKTPTKSGKQMRVADEMITNINYIKAQYVLRGNKVPSVKDITRLMAKKQDKEELYHEFYLKL